MQIKNGKTVSTLKALSVVIAAFSASHAFAEPSGGALSVDESIASLGVKAHVANVLSITGMSDVNFGTISPGIGIDKEAPADLTQTMSFCVYSNGPYTVSMASTSGLGRFNMYAPSVGNRLDYSVKLEVGDRLVDNSFGYSSVAESMLHAEDYGPFSYNTFDYIDQNCNSSDGQNKNFRATFSIDAGELMMATPAAYSDRMQIIARFAAPTPS